LGEFGGHLDIYNKEGESVAEMASAAKGGFLDIRDDKEMSAADLHVGVCSSRA
jgi:hypothetical protein